MIETAIILAGGFGTRLQTIVSDLPKPMAPVNNRPFLDYQFAYLKHYGIKQVIVSTGHLSEKIRTHYGNEYKGLKIGYSHEETPLGTGGGIRMALEKCAHETVLVLNGDSFFDVDIQKFYDIHLSQHSDISVALRRVSDAVRYGTIETGESNRIISFKEKAVTAAEALINGGVYILNKKLFLAHTPGLINFSIEKDFFVTQLNNLMIKGFEFSGYFIDIGIPEDYKKAQHELKEFKYR